MKKIWIITTLLNFLAASNYVVLDAGKVKDMGYSATSIQYHNAKTYVGSKYGKVYIYQNELSYLNKLDTKTNNSTYLMKLNNNIYSLSFLDNYKSLKVHKVNGNNLDYIKTLSFNKYSSEITSNNRYGVINLYDNNGGYLYIYNNKLELIKKKEADPYNKGLWLRDLDHKNNITYVVGQGSNPKDLLQYNIEKGYKNTILYHKNFSPFAMVTNNSAYYSKDHKLYRYNFKKERKSILVSNQGGATSYYKAITQANGLVLIKHTICYSDEDVCCENNLVFDDSKKAFIKNFLHSCSEKRVELDYKVSKFFRINNQKAILIAYREKQIINKIPSLERYIAINLNKASYNQLKNLKKYFINTIENKINKTLPKDSKIIIFNENSWVKYWFNKKVKFYITAPFAILTNNRLYIYTALSFTSQKPNTYASTSFNFSYTLYKNNRVYSYINVYPSYTINRHNKHLGENVVYEFKRISLNKGDRLKFVEGKGDYSKGEFIINLKVKDIISSSNNYTKSSSFSSTHYNAVVVNLYKTSDKFLAVRDEPRGELIGKLYDGDKLIVYEKRGKWYKIKRVSDGLSGWSYYKWIRLLDNQEDNSNNSKFQNTSIKKDIINFSNEYAKGNIKYAFKDNKLYLQVNIKNLYKDTKGGIFISFPNLEDKDRVFKKYSVDFSEFKIISKGGIVWNREDKKNIEANYLVVKAWSNNWRENRKKRVDLGVDFSNKDRVVVDIRAAFYKGKFLPKSSNIKDQQGYFVKRVYVK